MKTISDNGNQNKSGSGAFISPLSALALSFGYAVGWGSFVLPGNVFLPEAGPLGTLMAMLLGAAVMAVLALNFHRLVLRAPGPGGSYGFVTKMFGPDHGFLVAWFLILTYIAILWANATALVLLIRCLFGSVLQFGFRYTVAGFDVYFGEVLLCVAAILLCGGICILRKRLAVRLNTVLAFTLVACVSLCFATALLRHKGGFSSMAPAFAIDGSPAIQVLRILAMIPWAFVGFEAIVHSSGEFKFRDKRTFSILLAAIVISVFLYSALFLLPVIACPGKYIGWPAFIYDVPHLDGIASVPVFAAARNVLGNAGVAIIASAMLSAQLTALFCTYIAIGNLMRVMATDGALPRKFGRVNRDGTPVYAIAFAMCVSCVVPFLGRTVIGWPADVSSFGAAVAYCYVSAAAFAVSRGAGGRKAILGKAAGIVGFLMSVFFCLLLLVPNYVSGNSLSAEAYLLLALWCILGFYRYRRVFRKDRDGRYGRSTVVWVAILITIFFASLMWFRLAISTSAKNALSMFLGRNINRDSLTWLLGHVDADMLLNSFVEMCLLVVSLAIMINLFSLQRDREKNLIIGKLKAEESANKAKSYFFSTVSHDIRTPLNAIVGFSQMLKMGFKTEAERNQAIDAIFVSGKTLLSLLNDVLDFSKLEDGRMEIVPEPTDCVQLLRAITDTFRIANKKPGLEFRCRADGLPVLEIDPQRIRQILFNLVGNAAKFTDKGFVEVRGTFEKDAGDAAEGGAVGTFRIEVEDTGCGIGDEDMKTIAAPYVQVGAKLSRNGGTGLGLALCKELSRAMGGELTISSTLGKGSTFAVAIPGVKVSDKVSVHEHDIAIDEAIQKAEEQIGSVAEIAATEIRKPEAAPVQETPSPTAAAPVKRRILIVDDQKMNLMVLMVMLKKLGSFEIVMASNGVEAMKKLEDSASAPFDQVLTDMWMPEMDGEGLVNAIRANPKLSKLPVDVVTADVEMEKRFVDVGFDNFLLKPVTVDKLKKVIRI